MVETSSVDVMKANSEAFLHNLDLMEYQIKKVTNPFLLEKEGSIIYVETMEVDVTRVILAQTLKALKKESILKANYNVMFTDYSNFTKMSLQQNTAWQINFPDLLVCKLNKDEQLGEQSLVLKSLVDIVKDKYKKIIFIMQDSKLLESSIMKIGMAQNIKSKFVELSRSVNPPITKISNFVISKAKLDEQNVVNNMTTSKRILEEDAIGDVEKKRVSFQTVLHGEALANNASSVNLLQSLGVNNVNAVDKYGNTQLHLAAREGKTLIVKSLLAHGVKKDIRNNQYKTALHMAAKIGNSEIVKMLLEYGFDGNANQINQWTPLHYASMQNHAHVIEILLKFGAKIDRKDQDGQTALHLAAQWGHSEVVNVLLKHGANINAQNNDGDTPLHSASQLGEHKVVAILVQNGANINIDNKKKRTARDEIRKWKYYNRTLIFEKNTS